MAQHRGRLNGAKIKKLPEKCSLQPNFSTVESPLFGERATALIQWSFGRARASNMPQPELIISYNVSSSKIEPRSLRPRDVDCGKKLESDEPRKQPIP